MAGKQGAKFGNKNAAGPRDGTSAKRAALTGAMGFSGIHAGVNAYHGQRVRTKSHMAGGALAGAATLGLMGGSLGHVAMGAGLGAAGAGLNSVVGGAVGKRLRPKKK